MQKYEIAKWSW